MSNQARTLKVLTSLVISMTIGALVLMALDSRPLSAGAFSLSSYTNLDPIKRVMASFNATGMNWNRLEVFYSTTATGDLEQLAKTQNITNSQDLNFHFLVLNGTEGLDGDIQSMQKWKMQRSALSGKDWFGTQETIRVCVIADGETPKPTGCQVQRTSELVESLARKFNIPSQQISYPANWLR